MKERFNTSVGTLEVSLDRASRTLSIYRFDDQGRTVAAAIESWDHVDLRDVLNRRIGVPLMEAGQIASTLREQRVALGSLAERLAFNKQELPDRNRLENAGIALRFVAVLLDSIIVLFPLVILIGLLTGGGYAESGSGYANAGVNVGGTAFLLMLALGVGYYVVCETATGRTLGKQMVGIRVVSEDGQQVTFPAAIVRNLLRLVDALFFYLVGFLFAVTSFRGQRLGDRVAHTMVIRG